MGRTPSRTNKKTNESRGENGKKPQSLTEGINEKVNAAEEKVQEIEERGKPKRGKIAELTKQLEEAKKRAQQAEEQVQQQQKRIKDLEAEGKQKSEGIQILNDNLAKSSEKNERVLKANQDLLNQRSILTEAIRQGATKSDVEVTKAQKELESASEPKVDNSAKTEGTATPEGEAKATSKPEVKTEQAQATQEPAKEANARPGTGEVTKDNIISPEDAFKFFNNKENYDKASTVFKTPSFDEYIDATTGKWIPRSYFDAFNARDGIDPKKFTFEHFKAKIPEDPGKQLTAEEKTADIYNKNKAEEDYQKEYKNFNTGFKAYLRRHPKLEKILKTGKIAGGLGILYGIGQMFNDAYTAGQNDKDDLQNIIERLNDDDPEPLVGNANNNSTEDITNKLKDADASTGTPEDNSGTIEQAIAEQAPAGNAEPENPQVAANAATSTNTKANNAPASAAKSAPTQGLPPVVTRDAPPANPDSSGMTYSQRVEAGQAPKAGSMAYNSNNPDMVTAGLIDAMNQNPQAGSDAIGYGDLYDQNFIDFWAKRNPNLAFGVSQGRKS